jgi:monofunctional glycosyltransferase
MLKKLIVYSTILFLALIATDVAMSFVYPGFSNLKKENPRKTAFMECREKQWAKEGIKKTIIQKWVPLKRISPYLIKAVIIAEDDKFWQHEGFDFEAMHQALEKDIKKRQFKAGGSTISQQLAKNLYLSPSKNPVRKLKEAILTWRMERTLSKRRIVEIYLNVAEWGDGIFGIEAAARHYYGKHAFDLSAQEASRLAVVLPNPRKMNPVGNSKYVQNRSSKIFHIMVGRGIVITEFEEVMAEPEEKTETPLAGTLAAQATTTGLKPTTPQAAQENPPAGPQQETEKPITSDMNPPPTGGHVDTAASPGDGATGEGAR